MSIEPISFDADPPRLSGRIRRMSRPLAPLAVPIAGTRWLPLYVVLHHVGRRSGRHYATPVVGLATPDGFLIPLPFGSETQWARNIFAAGGGSLRQSGRDIEIGDPRIVDRGSIAALLPPLVRFLAGTFRLRQFVLVRARSGSADGSASG
jgi:deazaflavin-dependent oxidoreductase (nitroreductase family)